MNQVKKRVKNFGNRNETSARRGNAMASVGGGEGGYLLFQRFIWCQSFRIAQVGQTGGNRRWGRIRTLLLAPQYGVTANCQTPKRNQCFQQYSVKLCYFYWFVILKHSYFFTKGSVLLLTQIGNNEQNRSIKNVALSEFLFAETIFCDFSYK